MLDQCLRDKCYSSHGAGLETVPLRSCGPVHIWPSLCRRAVPGVARGVQVHSMCGLVRCSVPAMYLAHASRMTDCTLIRQSK